MKSQLEIILTLLIEVSMLRTAVATECSSPLGMVSRAIADNQLSASSSYNDNWLPNYARLNNNRAWAPRTNSRSEWLQMDLLERKVVSGIQTQGLQTFGNSYYSVTSFKLSYSDDATNWNIFQENGSDKIFVGNSNGYGVKENGIDPPIRARFIRLMAETWQRNIAVRLELLGCEIQETTTQMSTTTTTTLPATDVTTMTFMTTQNQTTQRVPVNTVLTSSIRSTAATIESITPAVQQRSTSPISSGAGASSPSFNSAIIGGGVAAGVVILIIIIMVSIFFVRRRQSRDTEGRQSAAQPEEMDRNNIRGPYISDDGEYVDTLPSNVNSQQNSGTDNVGYENIPMDAPVSTLQQIGTLGGDVYVNVPPASPSGQYEELRPAVYQSLQKVYENTPPSGGVYKNAPPPPPSGHYEELHPAVYQSLQKH